MKWPIKRDGGPAPVVALRAAARIAFFALGVGFGVGFVCAAVGLSTGVGLGECVSAVLSVSL